MKLTDEQIDKLFQESAAKQSFAYKPEYWEDFSSSLSANAPLSEAPDSALDAAFQESAASQSFEYKPEFWEAFSATLPSSTPLSEAPDSTLDAAFQESAAAQSFNYKPEFWEAFSATLPDSIPLSQVPDTAFDAAFQDNASAISVDYKPEFWSEFSDSLPLMTSMEDIADTEVDAMYRAEAANLSFQYKTTYWEEMAAALSKRRRRPEFVWFGLSGVFATAIIAMLFIDQSPLKVDWDAPEYSFNGITPQAANNRNVNLASNSGTTNSELNQFSGSNQATAQNVANGAANPANGNGTPSTPVLNENKGQNGTIDPNANNTNLAINNEPNGGTQGAPNNNQPTGRLNRITPELILTASQTATEQRTVGTTDVTLLSENDALETRALQPLEQQFNNELVASNLPPLPRYKGGVQSRMYMQALGGMSESAVIPSEVMSNSYGVGMGWEISKRNWTANLGSNLIIENYSDLFLSRFGKEYDAGSFSKRQDIRYQNLFSAELNLSIGREFGRHQIQIGLRPSYTFGSRMTQTITSSVSAFGETTESSETTSGINAEMLGIQRWGMKPTFGYAYRFSSNWTLGLNVGVELLQSIDETFITGINNRLPLDGQLYLRKTLNFRK
jgi:hypothetical protein